MTRRGWVAFGVFVALFVVVGLLFLRNELRAGPCDVVIDASTGTHSCWDGTP
jgi:hypothetical protein